MHSWKILFEIEVQPKSMLELWCTLGQFYLKLKGDSEKHAGTYERPVYGGWIKTNCMSDCAMWKIFDMQGLECGCYIRYAEKTLSMMYGTEAFLQTKSNYCGFAPFGRLFLVFFFLLFVLSGPCESFCLGSNFCNESSVFPLKKEMKRKKRSIATVVVLFVQRLNF